MRVKHVDALRGIAALLVTFFHLTGSSGLSKQTGAYGSLGFTGVELFFVISGFVLPYSMFKTNYQTKDFKKFMLKRIIRIYPPYLIIIVLGIIMAWITHRPIVPPIAIVSHILLLNGILGYDWISVVFWTLALEFQFYILIGLLYHFFSKSYKSSLITILALVFFEALVSRLFSGRSYNYIIHWFPFFAFGILIFNKRVNNMPLLIFYPACFMLIIYTYFQFALPETLAACFAAIWIITDSFNVNSIIMKVLLWFGKISYSLYLVHWELGRAGVAISRHIPVIGHNEWFRVFFGMVVSVFTAYFLYLFVEKPSIKYAHKIIYGNKPS